eukprot:347894-Chlamydomonas_euryale.AAC.5
MSVPMSRPATGGRKGPHLDGTEASEPRPRARISPPPLPAASFPTSGYAAAHADAAPSDDRRGQGESVFGGAVCLPDVLSNWQGHWHPAAATSSCCREGQNYRYAILPVGPISAKTSLRVPVDAADGLGQL